MQTNDNRKVLNPILEFSTIATIKWLAIARLANSLFAIATLKNSSNKKQPNNEPRLEPLCWQCHAEHNLLTLHTGSGELYVCHKCAGE